MPKYFNWRQVLLFSSVIVCTSLITITIYSQFLKSKNIEAKYYQAINDAYWNGPSAEKIAVAIIDLDNYYTNLHRENIDDALNFIATPPKGSCGTMHAELTKNALKVAHILLEKHKNTLAEPLFKDVLHAQMLTRYWRILALQDYAKLLRYEGKEEIAINYESEASKLSKEEKACEVAGIPTLR